MVWINCGLDQLWFGSRHYSRQGLEEINTYFKTLGLDQLWFVLRHESRQGLEDIITSFTKHLG